MDSLQKAERNAQVDIAKGLGICFVIIGHLIQYGHPLFRWIFGFHMPLFFFLSGYVFKCDLENLKKTIIKIVISLIVPYYLVFIVGVILSAVIPSWRPNLTNKNFFIQAFYHTQPLALGQVWFLFCLAVVQIFFVLLKKINLSEPLEILFAFFSFALAIGISYIYMKIGGRQFFGHTIPRPPFKIDTAFMGLFFFYLGHKDKQRGISAELNSKTKLGKALILLTFFSVNIVYTAMLNDTANLAANHYKNAVFFAFASITGIYLIFTLSGCVKKSRVLEFYGKNSLSIFSFHSAFLFAYVVLINKIFNQQFTAMGNIPIWLCFIGLVFVLICSIPIPFIYKYTIGMLVKKLKSALL